MTSEPIARRRRLSVDSRRDELLDAARDIFARTPLDEVNINDIAAAAGASRALVYHYFGGKNELYLASLRQTADDLIASLEGAVETPHDNVVAQLSDGLHRYFEFAESQKVGYMSLLRGRGSFASDEVAEIVEGTRQGLLDMLLTQTEIETPSAVLRVTLHGWMASVESAALDYLDTGQPDRAVLEQLLVGHLIAMLIPTASLDPALAAYLERQSIQLGS